MKCYKCGQDMSEDDNFCGVCGAENILKKYNEIKNSKNNEENIDQNNIQTDNGKKHENGSSTTEELKEEKESVSSNEVKIKKQFEDGVNRASKSVDDIIDSAASSMPVIKSSIWKYYNLFLNNKNAVIVTYVLASILLGVKWMSDIVYFKEVANFLLYLYNDTARVLLNIVIYLFFFVFLVKNFINSYIPTKICGIGNEGAENSDKIKGITAIVFFITAILNLLDSKYNFIMGIIYYSIRREFTLLLYAAGMFLLFNLIISGIYTLLILKDRQKEMLLGETIKFFIVRLIVNLILNVIILIILFILLMIFRHIIGGIFN